ncbi:MAG: helix-hairpin-helix domain-containing protein [Oligoflexia bacterium]|nr:helix-hairpin-helix domain-containing protein [Oligoflexia bacterium]MBF0364873.1 helix-hairpin-helix domain-containing protein [Oligoflexia bacterium]
MSFEKKVIDYCEKIASIAAFQVEKVLDLIVKQQCTVPFIARYRKEVTGNLDEVQIRNIHSAYEECLEIEKRRLYITEAIRKMEALTPELEKDIRSAQTLEQLEDIYAPYKSKKKTKAMIAREAGVLPLAEEILASKKSLSELAKEWQLPEGIPDFVSALAMAKDIIIEKVAHHVELKEELRQDYWEKAILHSTMRTKGAEVDDYLNFKDFFDFKEAIKNLKIDKNSHRFLAMKRGMTQKVLKLEVEYDEELAKAIVQRYFLTNTLGCIEVIKECIAYAYKDYIHPSLDLEIKTELKKSADEAAISVFGINLKNLLLAPYLGSKRVMAIDPGVRTGCKVVVIDESGKLLVDFVVYPHEPHMAVKESKLVLENAITELKVEYIAIGNGTYGRETLYFCEEHLVPVKEKRVKATMISESGASIYSASDIARKEFPDKDTTVRGSISIARRFQDPLAELVKIDPKSIGVGQYQHDVNESKLKRSLTDVVESCVNYVGVDLNTASAPLLSYISGIGPKLAESVVSYRQEKGRFKSREELLTVSRFTQKIYEQAAGFMRIYEGKNPLDATFIHPEKYAILEGWSQKKGISLSELVSDPQIQVNLERDKELESAIGPFTFKDVVHSLKAPRQDPRKEFKSVEFSKMLRSFGDLKEGEWYVGVVNNITQFGAFVDIGIKESGLLHVSEIANEFVENPLSKLQVGQEVKVRVIAIDKERKRISLSCRSNSVVGATIGSGGNGSSSARGDSKKRPFSKDNFAKQEIKNNPFGALKNIQLKK